MSTSISVLWAQDYQIKNDRILAPEVSHFARIPTPGVDAHGDLSLSIPLLTIPGRDGLDFPLVAQYKSGIQVKQSASWIGLGWELDLGSITRHALGGIQGYKQADFTHALDDDGSNNKIETQPDVYAVNMNGSSTLVLSMTKEVNPNLPFDPAKSETTGPCSGSNLYSQWFFITSPWKPWKFCYATSTPVTVDGKSTGLNIVGGNRRDFSKFIVTTENGARYVYSGAGNLPTLSHAYFPDSTVNYNELNYTFVSTWRLRAILSQNYTGPDVPDENSTGGWIKFVYKTWDLQTNSLEDIDTILDGGGRISAQITYPYFVETPTHFAFFTTSKRYDRDLAANLDCTPTCYHNGVENNYYSRKLDKITLYKKDPEAVGVPRAETAPGTYDVKISEATFTYLDNGARGPLESYNSNSSKFKQMLSKLALEQITISGTSGSTTLARPAYKFTYYDTFNKSWIDLLETQNNFNLTVFQDDFGFLLDGSVAKGEMWSLKQITYPEGGRQAITYANDSMATTTLSYKEYLQDNPSYTLKNGALTRAEQGGPRVQAISSYNGYNDSTPDALTFTYGPGRYSAIPETYFRKLYEYRGQTLYYLGERGQANVTYEWVKQKFPDNGAVKTFYFTGSAAHNPEPQILYKRGSNATLLQGNKNWNWGEPAKTEYLDAGNAKVKEEIYNWLFEGDYADTTPLILATVVPRLIYSSGTPDSIYLHFTHKELASKVTKHYFSAGATNAKELYTYGGDAQLATKTEIPADTQFDDVARKTEYVYAHNVSGPTLYAEMRRKNLRSQMAQVTVKKIIDYTTPPASPLAPEEDVVATATTWKAVLAESEYMHLPDREYRWRKSVVPSQVPAFDWNGPPGECANCYEWITAQTFADYDLHGNPTKINDAYNNETTVYWDVTGTLIDSITARPNATTTLTTRYAYDPNTFNLASITDPNGQKTEYKYDPLQRLIQTIMPDKRVASELAYYYSRQGVGNNDTFNATDPNYVKIRALAGAEFFEAFEYTDAPENHGWGVHYGTGLGTMTTVYDNTLQSRVMRIDVNTGQSNESYAVKYPATGELNTKSKHLWVKIKSSLGNSSFRVVVVRGGLEYSLRYYFDNGTNGYDSVNRFITIYLGAAFKDGTWRAFERDLEQDFKLTGLSTGYEYVKRIVAVGEYDLDQIQLQNHPVTSFAFADGVGRGIQTLQYDSTGAIKAGTFYDGQDRVVKVTKPFWHGNTKFVRVDSVIAYANSYHSTQHPAYYDGAAAKEFDIGNYAYAETEYFPDPLNRVRHQYAPGTVFSKADTNFVKYRYGANVANEMGIANAASVFETRIIDENDVKTEIFTDTFGNKVAVRNDSSGANNNGNSPKLATGFQYDILNNLTKIAPPKAFNNSDNNTPDWNSVFCTSMTYNTLAQLTSRQTPDAGTDSMYYDKKGNLRFVKDARGAAANPKYMLYYKYDNLGRRIAEGKMPASGYLNQANADDPSFPPEPEGTIAGDTVKVKYQYDVFTYSGSTPPRNLKGRLSAVEYRLDRFPAMKGYMFYSYDANGNAESIEQFIPKSNVNDGNGNLVARIEYFYDALGKTTKIYFRRVFPPGAGSNAFYTWNDYDALGRLERVSSNTSDARVRSANARYTYWPGGQVRRLVLSDTLQGLDYLYNSRDWLTQINHQNIYRTQDPGNDGGGSGVLYDDKFGQVIGYNQQKQIAVGHADFAKQFNGNISWTISNTFGNNSPVSASLTGWVFKYDKANRLTKANWGHYSSPSWQTSNRYDLTGIVYDRHGNLEYMTRYDQNNSATNMDYLYTANTNKLHQVSGLNGQGANNYTYDANGNMVKDVVKLGAGSTISYDYRNLPWRVPTTIPNVYVDFGYDGKGQRVSKNAFFYVPGLDGRVVAVYDVNGTLLYWNIWGLDLVGQRFWKQ